MNINFPSVDDNYIKDKVEAGYYANATEAIRDAVRKMRENDEQRAEFLAAIMVGKEQNDKSLGKPFTSKTVNRIKQNARARVARGEKPSSDVLP